MRLTPTALVLFLATLLARAAGSTEPEAAAGGGGGGGRERIPIMPTKIKPKTLEDAGLMSVRAPVLPKTLPPVSLMKRENDRAVVDRMAEVIKGGGGDEVEEEEEGARASHMSVMPKLSKPVSEMTDRELMERADSLGHDVDLANKISLPRHDALGDDDKPSYTRRPVEEKMTRIPTKPVSTISTKPASYIKSASWERMLLKAMNEAHLMKQEAEREALATEMMDEATLKGGLEAQMAHEEAHTHNKRKAARPSAVQRFMADEDGVMTWAKVLLIAKLSRKELMANYGIVFVGVGRCNMRRKVFTKVKNLFTKSNRRAINPCIRLGCENSVVDCTIEKLPELIERHNIQLVTSQMDRPTTIGIKYVDKSEDADVLMQERAELHAQLKARDHARELDGLHGNPLGRLVRGLVGGDEAEDESKYLHIGDPMYYEHPGGWAVGTIGGFIIAENTGEAFALTNAHVVGGQDCFGEDEEKCKSTELAEKCEWSSETSNTPMCLGKAGGKVVTFSHPYEEGAEEKMDSRVFFRALDSHVDMALVRMGPSVQGYVCQLRVDGRKVNGVHSYVHENSYTDAELAAAEDWERAFWSAYRASFSDVLEELIDNQRGPDVVKEGTNGFTRAKVNDFGDIDHSLGTDKTDDDQFTITVEEGAFSIVGDSGSSVISTNDDSVVGLLWGGRGKTSWATPIHNILETLKAHSSMNKLPYNWHFCGLIEKLPRGVTQTRILEDGDAAEEDPEWANFRNPDADQAEHYVRRAQGAGAKASVGTRDRTTLRHYPKGRNVNREEGRMERIYALEQKEE